VVAAFSRKAPITIPPHQIRVSSDRVDLLDDCVLLKVFREALLANQ